MSEKEKTEGRSKPMRRKIEALLASSKPIEPEDARECMQYMYDLLEGATLLHLEQERELASLKTLLGVISNKFLPPPLDLLVKVALDADSVEVREVPEEMSLSDMLAKLKAMSGAKNESSTVH